MNRLTLWGITFHSLLVTRCKITCYSLQNSLVTCCKNSLVTHCKTCLLLVAEVARCKNLFVVKKHSLLDAKFDSYVLHKVTKKSLCSGRQNLSKFQSIYRMLYINKNHVLLRCKVTKFSVVMLKLAHGSSHPMFCK